MYNVGGDMSGDPVTLESIAAKAKERFGKEPRMLSQLSFSGDLSKLSEEDVEELLNLVESLQDDKSAIFDPQGRKDLKRTIQSLEGSIGLDMDTTKSNIFTAMDDEAGFMDRPFVAAKKKAIDMALGKIMSEKLEDEKDVPELPLGGDLGNIFGNTGFGDGPFGDTDGDGIPNFQDNDGRPPETNDRDDDGGGNNLLNFLQNLGFNVGGQGDDGGGGFGFLGLGGGGDGGFDPASITGPNVYTFKDQSQIPAGFSLNKKDGGMIVRKKPRVYQDGGEMASDWDTLQTNEGFSWGGGTEFGATPSPEQMLGAASAFEQYAPGASAALMREYGDILESQRDYDSLGEEDDGDFSDADMAYLEMLPPSQRLKEMNKMARLERRYGRKEARRERRAGRKEARQERRDERKEKRSERKDDRKERRRNRRQRRRDRRREHGGYVSSQPRTYQVGGDMSRMGQRRDDRMNRRRDRLTARYGELQGIENPNRMQQRMMERIEQRLNRMEGRRRGISDPRGMFGSSYQPMGGLQGLLGSTGRKRITGGGDYRGGVHSGKPETMLDARGDMVSVRPGAGDMEGIIRLLRPYMNSGNTSSIGGNPMQSDPRPGIMTDSAGNPVMGTTNPFAPPSGLPAVKRGGGMLSPFRRMENGGSTDPKKKKVQVRGIESSLDMQIDDMIDQGFTPDFDYSGLNENEKSALYDAEINYLKKTGQFGSEDDEMDETQPPVLPDAPRQQDLAATYGITSPADMDKPAGGFNMRPVKTAQPQEQRTVNMSQGKTVTPSRSAMPNREQREFLQMRYESSGDPNKQSAYAAGLYGISPAVMSDAAKAGAIPEGADVFDPEINKKARDWFLDSLSEQEWIKNPPKPIGQANRLARIYGAYNEGPRNFKDNLQLAKDAGIDIYGDPAGWIDAKGKGAKYDGYFFPKETRDYVRGIVLGKIDPTRVPRGYKLSN